MMSTVPMLRIAIWLLLASVVPASGKSVSANTDSDETVDCHFDNKGVCGWKNVDQHDTKDWQLVDTDLSGHRHSGAMRYVPTEGKAGSAWLQSPLHVTLCFSFNYVLDLQPSDFLRVFVMHATNTSVAKVMWQLSGEDVEEEVKQGRFSIDSKYFNKDYRIVFIASNVEDSGMDKATMVEVDDTMITLGECPTEPAAAVPTSFGCDFENNFCGWSNNSPFKWEIVSGKDSEDHKFLADHTFKDKKHKFAAMQGQSGTSQLKSRFLPKGVHCLKLFYFMDLKPNRPTFPVLEGYTLDVTAKRNRIFMRKGEDVERGWHQMTLTIDSPTDFIILLEGGGGEKQFIALDDITVLRGNCPGIEVTDSQEHTCDLADSKESKDECEVLDFQRSVFLSMVYASARLSSNTGQDQTLSRSPKYFKYSDEQSKYTLVSDEIIGGSIEGHGDHCITFKYNMNPNVQNWLLKVYQVEDIYSFNGEMDPTYTTSTGNPLGPTEAVISVPSYSVYRLVFEANISTSGDQLVISEIHIKNGKCFDKYKKCAFYKGDNCYWKILGWDNDLNMNENYVLYPYPQSKHPGHSLLMSEILQPSSTVVENCFTFKYHFDSTNLGALRVMINADVSDTKKGTIVELWYLNSNDSDSAKFTGEWNIAAFNIAEKWLKSPFKIIIDALDITEPVRGKMIEIDDTQLLRNKCEKNIPQEAVKEAVCEDPKCFNMNDKEQSSVCTCRSESDTSTSAAVTKITQTTTTTTTTAKPKPKKQIVSLKTKESRGKAKKESGAGDDTKTTAVESSKQPGSPDFQGFPAVSTDIDGFRQKAKTYGDQSASTLQQCFHMCAVKTSVDCTFESNLCGWSSESTFKWGTISGQESDKHKSMADHTFQSKESKFAIIEGHVGTAELQSTVIPKGYHCLQLFYFMDTNRKTSRLPELRGYAVDATSKKIQLFARNAYGVDPGWHQMVQTIESPSDFSILLEGDIDEKQFLALDDITLKKGMCPAKEITDEKCNFDHGNNCYWKLIGWDNDFNTQENFVIYPYPPLHIPHHSLLISERFQPPSPVAKICFTFRYYFTDTSLGALRVMLNTDGSDKERSTIVEFWHLNSNDSDSEKFTGDWKTASFNIAEKWLRTPFQIIIDAHDITNPVRGQMIQIDDTQLLSSSCEEAKPIEAVKEAVCDDPICFDPNNYWQSSVCTCRSPNDISASAVKSEVASTTTATAVKPVFKKKVDSATKADSKEEGEDGSDAEGTKTTKEESSKESGSDVTTSVDCTFEDNLCGWSSKSSFKWETVSGQGSEKHKFMADHTFQSRKHKFAIMEGQVGTAELQSPVILKGDHCLQLFYFMDIKHKTSRLPELKAYAVDATSSKKTLLFTRNVDGVEAEWHQMAQTIDFPTDFSILLEGEIVDKQFLALDDITVTKGKCQLIEITDYQDHRCSFTEDECEVLDLQKSSFFNMHYGGIGTLSNPGQGQTPSTSPRYFLYSDGKSKYQLVSDVISGTSAEGHSYHCVTFKYNLNSDAPKGVLNVYQVENSDSFHDKMVPAYTTSSGNPAGLTEAVISVSSQSLYRLVFEADNVTSDKLVINDIHIKNGKCVAKYEKCTFNSGNDCYWKILDWDNNYEKIDENFAIYPYPRPSRPHHSLLISKIFEESSHVVENCFSFRYKFSSTNLGALRVLLNWESSSTEQGSVVEFWYLNSNDSDSKQFTGQWNTASFNIDAKWLKEPFKIVIDAQDIVDPKVGKLIEVDDTQLMSYSCESNEPHEAVREKIWKDPVCFDIDGESHACTCLSPKESSSTLKTRAGTKRR